MAHRFQSNSAWHVLSIMAFNLMRGLQAHTTTTALRRTNRKRRIPHCFELIQALPNEPKPAFWCGSTVKSLFEPAATRLSAKQLQAIEKTQAT